MSITPNLEEISTELRAYFNAKNRVLGAQVGYFLKTRFQGLDYRNQYKSLKEFLEAIFPGEITVVGKSGPDDILMLGEASPNQLDAIVTACKPNSLNEGIEIFRNPTLSGHLFYDAQRKQFFKSAELDGKNASGSLSIARMTHTDQRAIMGEFAQNYSEHKDISGLASTLEGDDPLYWQKFFMSIKRAKLVQEWLEFRNQKVIELLKQKLKDAGAPEEDIPKIAVQASLGKSSRHAKNPKTISRSRERASKRPTSLTDLACTVISHMSEAQIRELKIPLGAIWDSFQQDR